MYIEYNSIIFNSIPKYWAKEHSGKKSNTIRVIPPDEIMLYGLNFDDNGTLYSRTKEIAYIVIENTETHERFSRRLTDVSLFNNIWVFSWNHKTDDMTINRLCEQK